MPDRSKQRPPRKAVARDPLADLGEITGVLRRVRPAERPTTGGRPAPPERASPSPGRAAELRETIPPQPPPRGRETQVRVPEGRDPRWLTLRGPSPRSPVPGAATGKPRATPVGPRSPLLFEMLDEPPEKSDSAQGAEVGAAAAEPEGRPDGDGATGSLASELPGSGYQKPAHQDLADIERRYEEGKRYVATGDFTKAIGAYHEVLRRDPTHVRARNNLGFAYDCRGDFDLAINEYLQALELDSKNVQVWCNLGAVYGAKGRYEKAEEALKQGLRIDPKSAEAHCNLGIVYCKKGMYHLATAELKRALDLDADSAQAFYYLGECYNHLDRHDEAIASFERALKEQPQNHKAYYNLGILFDKKNMPERAMLMYRRARELQGSASSPSGA